MTNEHSIYHAVAEKAFHNFYGQPYRVMPPENDWSHIINIGRSILMHRDKVLGGGGFVTAVCQNDLVSAVQRADSVCQKNLSYFVYCLLHVDIPKEEKV
jgi:hypothetical protein